MLQRNLLYTAVTRGPLDAKITEDVWAGLEVSDRSVQAPVFLLGAGRYARDSRHERLFRSYLYWTPYSEWALAAEVNFDTYHRKTGAVVHLPSLVETLRLPVTARWFSPLGLFAGLTTSFIHQDVSRRGASVEEGSSTFAIVDAAAGYRFPDRRGLVSVEVRNLFDSAFRYQDDSFRAFTNEPSVGPYIPERTLIARLAVNF